MISSAAAIVSGVMPVTSASVLGKDALESVGQRRQVLAHRRFGPRPVAGFDAVDADAGGYEPVWSGDRKVGFVTSGGYGYTVGKSLAMALVDRDVAGEGTALSVHVVGVECPATVIAASPYDPDGRAMRG